MTFEEYQSYEPGQIAIGHEGEVILYIEINDEWNLAINLFLPLIYMDEKFNKLIITSE